ncbi:PREDICTED: glutamate receptor 2-like isoform X2 [Acropora digitifera]|uniref:glutamate receptor 2-like isoform X2 n=1 Tax=Acropora digitifera TaxID=70779 RepID=UPI00077AB42F|nr:PREDICTED: glutamate receptor 2-like isoform X2 [Acropora digitifera]
MQGRITYLLFLFTVGRIVVQTVCTSQKVFTCGVISTDSEFDAITFALNYTATFSNITINLRTFNATEPAHGVCKQASELLQHNVIALLDGSHTKIPACALATITNIPLIHLHGNNLAPDRCAKAIQLSADYKDYAHASLDIINTFHWKNIALVANEGRFPEAAYLYGISQDSKFTLSLLQLTEKEGTNARNENGKASMQRLAENIANLDPEVILLYTTEEKIQLLMAQTIPGKSRNYTRWIIQGQVRDNFTSLTNDVVLALRHAIVPREASGKLDQSLLNWLEQIGDKYLAAQGFDTFQLLQKAFEIEPCSSINASKVTTKDRENLLDCMKKVNLDGITGEVQFDQNGRRNGIHLEILNLQNNSFKKIGKWNTAQRAVFYNSVLPNIKQAGRGRLDGSFHKVVIALDAPFVMIKQEEDGTISYEGFCIDLLKQLAKMLHFSYEIYLSPDGQYGAITENGTWNGMLGELVNKRADIALAGMAISEVREKSFDFSVPFMHYTDDILLKKRSSDEGKTFNTQFMQPFEDDVWLATLVTLVLISVSFFALNYISPYGYKDENGQGTSEDFSFINSVWFAWSCMLQQGAETQPRSISGRILAGSYWFCILIWVSTYTANLAAFFTVKNTQQGIKNLEDVLRTSYKVGIRDETTVSEFFEASQYDQHRKIWHRIQTGNNKFKSTPQAIQWVRETEESLFIYDGPILRHVANQPPCDLISVPGLSTAKGYALAFQAGAPNVSEFSLAILRLNEQGFLGTLTRKWWDNTNKCPVEETTKLTRISLKSMLGVYIVLGVGMLVAFFTMIGEILWNRRQKRKLETVSETNREPREADAISNQLQERSATPGKPTIDAFL